MPDASQKTCPYRLNQANDTARNLVWILDNSNEDELIKKSSRLANFILRSQVSEKELRNLLDYASGPSSAALITTELVRLELADEQVDNARALIENYKSRFGSNDYSAQIEQLLKGARNFEGRAIKIGVLLPLTGDFSKEGMGVVSGIRFAHASNKKSPRLQLVIRDSESNMIKAIKGVQELIKKEKVRAVIGDLESAITAGIGALASNYEITVISPTATENDVASVGGAVYQLNSDLKSKGKALAKYAFKELGLKTFATLAPADDYGQQMTASFTAEIDRLGGRIITQSFYYGNPQDLSSQFKSIRQAAFHFDSTNVAAILRKAKAARRKLDEIDIPVNSIDGIFLPIFSEDIQYIAPQFALYNIRSQILGGEYWDTLEILQKAQIEPYVNGVVFVSDYFPDEESKAFRDFRNNFRVKMRRNPERWEAFGYDAYNLISKAIDKGAKTGKEIHKRLNSISDYQGIKGRISFKGNKRVNKDVNILQFVNGKIVRHQSKTSLKK